MAEYDTVIDHNKIIPAEERTGAGAYSITMLCKQDKEQLDRIEKMLIEILNQVIRGK